MIRRITAMLLILAALLCLASCGNAANGSEDTTYETVMNDPVTATVYITFMEVDGETGKETPLIANSAFSVTADSGSDLTVLYTFINYMASNGFLFELNDKANGIKSALDKDNTDEKYWTCVVKQDGNQDIDLSNFGGDLTMTLVNDGNHLVFKYVDRD